MDIQNHFTTDIAAAHYAAGRPYFHPLVIERLRAVYPHPLPVARALDVACGTGQSTVALAEIADAVDGTDLSPAMLNHALAHPRVRYQPAPAEEQPFPDAAFDLITVCMGFHWFDQPRFLAEAARLLRPHGWLVIYNAWFTGQMYKCDDYAAWMRETVYGRYPNPSRHGLVVAKALEFEPRLAKTGQEDFTTDRSVTRDQLIAYLITQSNFIAAVARGEEEADIIAWLQEQLDPWFAGATRTFGYGVHVDYCVRE